MKKKEKIEYREKIKNAFFDVLKENDFTVENIEESNGYFLFEFGEKTVFHFDIKEIKKWKFGLWIRDGKKKDSFRLEFFGDKIDWIDKFKPTASTLSHDKEYTVEDFDLKYVEEIFDKTGFKTEKILSVSNFRSKTLKKLFKTNNLVKMEDLVVAALKPNLWDVSNIALVGINVSRHVSTLLFLEIIYIDNARLPP